MASSSFALLPPIEVQYVRTVFYDGGAVRDEDDGLSAMWLTDEIVEETLFCVSVQCTGSLVEEQDGALSQQGACYGNTLCLSLAHARTLFSAE